MHSFCYIHASSSQFNFLWDVRSFVIWNMEATFLSDLGSFVQGFICWELAYLSCHTYSINSRMMYLTNTHRCTHIDVHACVHTHTFVCAPPVRKYEWSLCLVGQGRWQVSQCFYDMLLTFCRRSRSRWWPQCLYYWLVLLNLPYRATSSCHTLTCAYVDPVCEEHHALSTVYIKLIIVKPFYNLIVCILLQYITK